jgi:hypothetical protein
MTIVEMMIMTNIDYVQLLKLLINYLQNRIFSAKRKESKHKAPMHRHHM